MINLGNYGNVIAQRAEVPVAKADTTIGDALIQFGKIAGQEAVQQQEELDSIDAGRRVSEFETRNTGLLEEGQRLVAEGNIRADEFSTWYGDRVSELADEVTQGARESLANRIKAGLERAKGGLKIRAMDMQRGMVKEQAVVGIMQTSENLLKEAGNNPNVGQQFEAYLNNLPPTILSPTDREEQLSKFYGNAARINAATTIERTNSIGEARTLYQRLRDDTGFMSNLTAEARLQVTAMADARVRELKAEADRVRRETEAQRSDMARTLIENLSSGLQVDKSIISQAAIMGRGNDKVARAVRTAADSYKLVREQQLKPFSEQAASLKGLRSQVEAETSPERRLELLARYDALAKSYTAGVNAFKADPLTAYQERTGAPMPQLDLSSSEGFMAGIQARAKYATGAKAMWGRQVDLLTNAEAESFVPYFTKLPVSAQADMLAAIRKAGGDDAAVSLAGAISKRDSTLGLAAYHAARGGMTTEGRGTSQILLRGMKSAVAMDDRAKKAVEQALGKQAELFGKDSTAFASYLGGAMAAYKTLSEEDGDMLGGADTSRARRAVNLALGVPPVEINGRMVLPPVGRGGSRFINSMVSGIEQVGRKHYKLEGEALAQFASRYTVVAGANDVYTIIDKDTGEPLIYPRGSSRAGAPIMLNGAQ